MSHLMTALAMKQKGLKPAAKIVLYWLADHHNGETGQCNPSINRLADCCEMSRRSVEAHLQSLQDMGLIKISNQFREKGGKTSNIYTLCLTKSDAQNLRMVYAKSAHGDTQNLRMKNLGTINLGKEQEDQSAPDPCLFDEFWDTWPLRKVGKAKAKVSFLRLSKQNQRQAIDRAVDWAKKWKQEYPTASDIHPTSYINGKRWEDEAGETAAAVSTKLDRWKKIAQS